MRAEWVDEGGDVLAFWIEADSFMRHMVRTLVGTMLAVASGRLDADEFEACSRARPRREAGDTAPATGSTWSPCATSPQGPMKVLLTNDDGIQATGLNAMRRALLELPGHRAGRDRAGLQPQRHGALDHHPQAAVGRGDRVRRRHHGFATDGTPVDCVRFAALGLVEFEPELIVSGINHGSNLGDDITYSGTVAAALEGIVLGMPAIAVSQQAEAGRDGLPRRPAVRARDFEQAAAFVARHGRGARATCRCPRARC